MIIDGKNAVLGRMFSRVAKLALLGNKVDVINCESIIISGKREAVLAKYSRIRKMGTPRQGPFLSSNPEKFCKRIVRGMLPYKNEKGRAAYERIKFFRGVPEELKDKEAVKIAQSKLRISYVTVGEICKAIGGKE